MMCHLFQSHPINDLNDRIAQFHTQSPQARVSEREDTFIESINSMYIRNAGKIVDLLLLLLLTMKFYL